MVCQGEGQGLGQGHGLGQGWGTFRPSFNLISKLNRLCRLELCRRGSYVSYMCMIMKLYSTIQNNAECLTFYVALN